MVGSLRAIHQPAAMEPVADPTQRAAQSRSAPAEEITFWGEVKKGQDWILFIRQMVSRLDSPQAWFGALSMGVGALLMIVPKSIRCALIKLGIIED